MGVHWSAFRRVALSLVAVLALSSVVVACGSSDEGDESSGGGTGSTVGETSRGFDGKTITVAGIGAKAQLPGAEWGARARVAKFNDTNELPGVKIEYAEFVDDKLDPATALSEVRRLVTATKVFAVVGDTSGYNPGEYFKQQHVPYFGAGWDNSYCSNSGDTSLYGFGFNGCTVPSNPKAMPDTYPSLYEVAKEKSGEKQPTVASFSTDSAGGHNSTKYATAQLEGVGFDVVYAKGVVPPPPVSDYTPYVQQLMTADGGKAPDTLVCLLAVDCIPIWKGVQAAGFKGIFYSPLYSDALLEIMKGTYSLPTFVAFDTPSDGYLELQKYLKEVKPDAVVDIGVFAAWASTDMFIQALKAAAKDGGISPENVQEKAMHMTWEIEGFAGPTKYPESLAVPTPLCVSLVYDDGTRWKTVKPYSCSKKTWPIAD